jgi:hypothetical protein
LRDLRNRYVDPFAALRRRKSPARIQDVNDVMMDDVVHDGAADFDICRSRPA